MTADARRRLSPNGRRFSGRLFVAEPFGDLPASCEAMETQIRQVRLCIEVLRSYLKPLWPTLLQSVKDVFAAAEKKYLWSTYTGLLGRLGTSYTESLGFWVTQSASISASL
jgi:hypothetical protein